MLFKGEDTRLILATQLIFIHFFYKFLSKKCFKKSISYLNHNIERSLTKEKKNLTKRTSFRNLSVCVDCKSISIMYTLPWTK